MSMLSLLARLAFLVTSPEGYTVVSYVSFSFFYQRKWLLCFSGIIHTPFIWNCLELDSDPLRGRVREYLQTMFKLEMYRYYLEKYILDHVLQIFRGGGRELLLFLSLKGLCHPTLMREPMKTNLKKLARLFQVLSEILEGCFYLSKSQPLFDS